MSTRTPPRSRPREPSRNGLEASRPERSPRCLRGPAAGGAPNLKRVIDLARTACAADLLGNPGYTVRAVVNILGYASPSHLAGAARRVAGVVPHELRDLGPRGVLGRFVRGRTRSRL